MRPVCHDNAMDLVGDVASMAAGNTSAFNCRDVVGRPGVRSPHSYGRALDLNPSEDPYRVGGQWLPNA